MIRTCNCCGQTFKLVNHTDTREAYLCKYCTLSGMYKAVVMITQLAIILILLGTR